MTIQNVQLNRTVGLELEGYITSNPHNISMLGMDWSIDESLRNCYYDEDGHNCSCWDEDDCSCYDNSRDFGVEYKTEPIANTVEIEVIYNELKKHEWDVDSQAGLHIHVHANDFNIEEKAKLLRFAKGIEHIMFTIIESYRDGNSYCEEIHEGWRHLFRKDLGIDIDWNELNTINTRSGWERHAQYQALTKLISENRSSVKAKARGLWNGRYQWLNALTDHETVEFRLFSATKDVEVAKRFSLIAHNIVETVKYSTIQQLNFIVKSVYEQHTVENMITTLMTSIGLEGLEVPILNTSRARKLEQKYCSKNRGENGEQVAV